MPKSEPRRANKNSKKGALKRRAPTPKGKITSLMPMRGMKARKKEAGIRLAMLLNSLGKADEVVAQFHTSIPELRSLGITERERKCFVAILNAEKKNFPMSTGGVALRYRIEIAAAFLSMVIHHAYSASEANGLQDPEAFAAVSVDLTVNRAREVWAQGSG